MYRQGPAAAEERIATDMETAAIEYGEIERKATSLERQNAKLIECVRRTGLRLSMVDEDPYVQQMINDGAETLQEIESWVGPTNLLRQRDVTDPPPRPV